MKKRFLLLFFSFCVYGLYAQVGIGTPMPDNSAQLDVVAGDKGILIPRVALSSSTDNQTIASGNVNSLLVFNTATQGDITPGYYYWYDNRWRRIVSSGDVVDGNIPDKVMVFNPVTSEINYIDENGDMQVIGFEEIVQAYETVSTLVNNGNGTYTYTDEEGVTTTIDIPADILNDIAAGGDVFNEIFRLIQEYGGNVNYDGYEFTYIDENGNVQLINFGDIVRANETLTILTDNGNGTVTYTDEEGVETVIDLSAIVDSYETLTSLVDNGNGTITYTDEEGNTTDFDANTTSYVANGDGSYTFTNANGDSMTVDVAGDVVENIRNQGDIYNEILNTITANSDALVDNGDGTFTHTAADGTVVTFDANTITVTDNGDGTYTITNADSTAMTVDVIGDVVTDIQNQGDVYNEIISIIDTESDALVDNGNGTFTHTAADGTVVTFDANTTTLADNDDGTYTLTNADGTIVTVDTNAGTNSYDNTTSGLAATNVQDALDEIQNNLDNTSDVLADNGDGTYTHTAVDGTEITIDANTTGVTVVDGVYTFTDGNGDTITTIDTDAGASGYDNTSSGLASDNVQGAIDEIVRNIDSGAGVALEDNGDGTVSLVADDGTVLGTVNKTAVTDNNDGTYTLDSGNGTPVTIDTNAGALAFDNSSNGFTSDNVQGALEEIKTQLDGTTDVLIDNLDGTYTHTAVDGTEITIDANTIGVTVVDGVYTFTDGNGDTITTIDTNAGAIAYDNSTSGLTSDNTQGAMDELAQTIENNKGDLTVNGGLEFTGNTDGVDKLLGDAGIEVADGGIDNAKLANDAVSESKIQDGTITSSKIQNGEVKESDLGADAVSTDKIQNKAVSPEKLGTDGVPSGQVPIADGSGGVVYGNLSSDNVDGKDLTAGDGSVTVVDGTGATLVDADVSVSPDGITNDKLADNAVQTENIIDGAVTSEKIGADAVTSDKILDGEVQTADIADGAVSPDKMEGGTADQVMITNAAGDVIWVDNAAFVQDNETVTTIEENTTGIYTYTNEAGMPWDIHTEAGSNPYDNTASGLASDNVQGAIDEIVNNIDSGAGVALADNGDGTVSLVADDGTVRGTVDKTAVTDNNDGTYTLDSGNGTPVTIDTNAGALAFDNSSNGFTSDNVQGALEEIKTQLDGTTDVLIDNLDGTYTHTAVDGTEITINANTTGVTVVDGVYTFTDGNGDTITTIDTNAGVSGYDNTGSGLASDNVQGAIDEVVNNIDSGAGVALADNGDGTVSLVADDGTVRGTVDKTAVTDNNDGTYTLDSGNGTPVTIDTNAGALAFDNSSNGFTSDNVQGALEEIKTQLDGTTDVLIDNLDGTYTHTAVDGTEITINANTTGVTVVDGVYTFTDGNGDTITTIDTNAGASGYDNTGSGLASDNVQGAIDEVVNSINSGAGVALQDNNDGTVTLLADDGTDLGTVNKSDVTDNGGGIYTFTNNDGTDVTIDTNADTSVYDNTGSGLASDNVQDAIDELTNMAGIVSPLTDNGDGTFTYTDEEGNITDFDANTTGYVANGDGSYTFTNANGESMTLDVVGDITTDIQNQGDVYNEIISIIDAGSDALVDNGDGTFTHAAADGTVVTFDANTVTMADNADGSYTLTNTNGDTVTIDTSAGSNPYDNTDSGLASDNVQGAIDEILQNLEDSNASVDLVDNGDGMVTLVRPDGTEVSVNKSDITDNTDGTYTFTNNDGTDVTIDTNADTSGYDNTDSGLTSDSVQDAIDEIVNNIGSGGGVGLVDNGDGTVTLVADDGTELGSVDKSEITDNQDGTYTFNNGDGTPVTVDVIGDVADNIANQGDIYNEIVNVLEGNSDELVDNGDGTYTHTAVDGTIEEIKAAMPKFFYMPSIVFDTSVTGTGLTRDLYQEYADQFGTPMVSSAGAAGAIPTLPATELEYHITYYDTTVFANVSVDANGILTYDVIGDATPASFMNIVFVVK
ncbi:hypothetical protein LS482_02995 [Sinomicrobium kalidii]|uniref:beta strand repeat-containing protein n=1 Tax=Sinomicrobium kalidii TaxID=2900738 RepID=UPI001E512B34|nr:hypothetical protein [Sinomicrobium kalidii]UGU16846.1 hypothetical protein LS482_02995 [Sinomicrobium kalidii]